MKGKRDLLPKITAVCWLRNTIEELERRAASGELRWFGFELHELRQVLQYIKAAPAPKPTKKGKR